MFLRGFFEGPRLEGREGNYMLFIVQQERSQLFTSLHLTDIESKI